MMNVDTSLFAGVLVGFSVAAPIGPMGLLCIQRTFASGMRVGLSTGIGGATANVIYGAAILLGLGEMASWMQGSDRTLRVLGGLFLLWSAVKTIRRRSLPQQPDNAPQAPLPAYVSAVAFNLANPTGMVLMLALLSPLAGVSGTTPADAAALLFGIFVAAGAWWLCVTGTVAMLRSRLSAGTIAYVNYGAGMLLAGYGLLALMRSVRL